jgi:hypothetical protein
LATSQEAISRLSIQSTLTGEAEVTAGLKRISAAQDGVAVSSSSSERATVSLEKSFANIERRYVAGVASQQQYAKIQAQVNAAVAQNPALQDRANVILAEAAKRHDALTGSQKALGVVANDLNSRIQANAGSFGVLGQALSALGPVGVGIAATMGVVIGALYAASSSAHALADKAKEIREFSEATGLTTTQFQALRSEAGKFGIDSETLSHGLSKFTAGYDELRKGGGALLTDIRKINPALADQMQTATDSATAFTLFGKAVQQTDNIFQRNALLKAGLGKGSAVFGSFFESAPDVTALTNAFAAAGKGLDENLIKKLAILNADIARTQSAASTVFASVFAESVLTSERQFANVLLDIAKTFKLISENAKGVSPAVSDGLKTAAYLLTLTNPVGALIAGARYIASKGAQASDAKAASPANFVSPANDYSKFQAGATPVAAKTPEALAADLKNLVGVLGSAATPAEKLNAQIAELGIKAKEAGQGADILARGVAGLKLDDAIARQSAHNAALGAAASVTDIVKERMLVLTKARQQDNTITDAQAANVKRVATEQAEGTYQIQTAIDAEKVKTATLFMGTEAAMAYSIAQDIINKKIQAGQQPQTDEIQRIKQKAAELAKVTVENNRYDAAIQKAKGSAEQFGTSLFQSLLQGKSGMDALNSAFTQLSSSMASASMKDLFKGNFLEAGIEAVVAVGAQLFANATDTKQAKALQEAQQQWAKMSEQVINFNAAAKGFDLGPLTSQLQSLHSTSKDLQDAAAKAHDSAGEASAANAFNSAVERIWAQFKTGTQTLDPLQQQIKAVNDEAAGLKDTLNEIGFSGRAAQIDGIVQQQIDALTKQFNATFITGLTARLNTATGQTFLNDAANLLVQHQQDLTQAGELGNDPTLLAQVASTFHAEAQKIVDDAGLVGSAFTDFTKQFPDLAGVVVQANQDMSASAKQLQDAANATAKSITDYVNGLFAGSSSTLSPTQQLASAQLSYNTKLGLAQGGNADAQSSITTDAQNLLTAARAVYASSTGYQSIFQNVTSQLLNLPAVQQTTDPTVQAMRDVLTAINIGNAALNAANNNIAGTTSAVNASNSIGTLTGQILPAVTAGNAANVAAALASYFNAIDPSGGLAAIFGTTKTSADQAFQMANNAYYSSLGAARIDTNNTLTGAGNALTGTGNTTLAAIQGLQATAADQLTLLRNALAPTTVVTGPTITSTGAPAIGTPAIQTQNQLVAGINKIVYNTAVIAHNTSLIVPQTGGSGPGHIDGVFAQGGWVRGGIPGRDSVHIMAMQDEFMVNRNATRSLTQQFGPGVMDIINTGRLPFNDNRPVNVAAPVFRGGGGNSNAELLAEVRALRNEVEQLRKENNMGNAAIANTTSNGLKEHGEKLGGKIEASGKRSAFAASQAAKEKAA